MTLFDLDHSSVKFYSFYTDEETEIEQLLYDLPKATRLTIEGRKSRLLEIIMTSNYFCGEHDSKYINMYQNFFHNNVIK